MTEFDFGSYDLDSPKDRRTFLSNIGPNRARARELHAELLKIFEREMDFRKAGCPGDDADYFESIYLCGLLLYLVGDLADVPLMWKAKNIDMDTGCGFDVQFLVGAGVDETISYLQARGDFKSVAYLDKCKAVKDFDDLPRWERFRIKYFYPDHETNSNQ